MTPTITIDTKKFTETMRSIASITDREIKDVVKQQAGLFAESAAKMVPPFNPRRANDSSWAEAQRIGKAAIKRQAYAGFQGVFSQHQVKNDPKLKRKLRYLLSIGMYGEVAQILTELGIPNKGVVQSIDEAAYDRIRNRRGRINAKIPIMVDDASSIAKMVKLKQSHLGTGKSGWKESIALAGRKLPGWIANKNGTGYARTVQSEGGYVVEVANTVDHAQENGERLRIIKRTFRFREQRMKLDIERAVFRALKLA